MKIIIDRFEGNFAVVEFDEGSGFADMPIELIPPEARERDVINITIDRDETSLRKENIKNMMNKIFDKN